MPKNSKRGHSGSFNVFYKPKTSKKCKGVPFDKIRKFSKKSRIVPKKNPKGGPFGLTCTFGSIKIEPTLSGLVEDGRWTNMKNEQIVRKVDHSEWDCQLKKTKKTTHCKSRAFFLKGKGAD